MKKKRRVYLIIIAFITLVCVIGGGIYNYNKYKNGWSFEDLLEGEKSEAITETIKPETFNSIDIKTEVMNIKLVVGDGYEISYECTREKNKPKLKVENGTLVMEQKANGSFKASLSTKCKMTITVPKDMVFNEIKIESSMGDIDMDEIEAEKTTIKSSKGDFNVDGCKLGKTYIESNTGGVLMQNTKFEDIDISTDVGSVIISECPLFSKYSLISMKTNSGSMLVNNEYYDKKYTKESESNGYEMMIRTDMGDINISN